MATARDVLTGALRRMGILSQYEDMTADQGANGLSALNDLLAGFNAEGINYAHTDLTTLDGIINVPDELRRSVILMAVRELADPYGFQLTPQLLLQIDDARNSLQAYYELTPEAVSERLLWRRRYGSYDIDRDV